MNIILKPLALAGAALLIVAALPAPAEARPVGHGAYRGGYHGGWHHGGHYVRHGWGGRYGYWGPGLFLGGVGIGLGVAAINGYGYDYGYRYGAPVYYDDTVIVDAPPVVTHRASANAAAPAPDPIFYPRNGQSDAQKQSDRQECNRWATTQPSSMADASVFHRATLACMEGRGYTAR